MKFRRRVHLPSSDAASVFNPNALNLAQQLSGPTATGCAPIPRARATAIVYDLNRDNWAPRIGFSYQTFARAVIHGGYGIFFPESVTSAGARETRTDSLLPLSPMRVLDGGVTPNPKYKHWRSLGRSLCANYRKCQRRIPASGERLGKCIFGSRPSPYVPSQWMLGVQYAITTNDQLEVNYIGNRGVRMIGGPQL